jgi:Tol biopolymer transport system component
VRTLLSGVAITQLTDSAGGSLSLYPAISSDGTHIAFESNADLTGENGDGNFEIFSHDDISGTLSQVTHTTAGGSHVPSISGDGSRIVFHSSADPIGHNPDGNLEIFLFDAATGGLTQVTDATGRDSQDPAISGDGSTIAFESWANLTGKNTDRSREIFTYDVATGNLTQVTDSFSGQSQGASISADGRRIAFHSNANLIGQNGEGNFQIFLFDATTSEVTQVTDSQYLYASSFDAAISSDGTSSAFNTGFELRMLDTTTNSLTDITMPNKIINRNVSLDSDGTRIFWESNGEIVVYDMVSGGFVRVARGAYASVDGHGTTIAFQSDADLTGDNADGSVEIFIATVGGTFVDDVHLFYNNSVHDGNGPAVTEADFNAIATDKDPLHTGSATFANVSGYSRGINGLFIDVLNLPRNGAGVRASDLQFAIGEDNSGESWASIAALDVGVFPNAGRDAADRIFVTFADRAIVDKWLKVTVLATEGTGLLNSSTYFFGSVPGDTGRAAPDDSQFFGRNNADLESVAADLFQTADAANPNDLNRDGSVNAFDLQVIPLASGGGVEPHVIQVMATVSYAQVTDGGGIEPTISSDGTKIAFVSAADLTGNNADGNSEIFLFDTIAATLTQLTDTTGGHSSSPSIDSDGTRIAFESTANPTGSNADGNPEIFLFDVTTGSLIQVTDAAGRDSRHPTISGDGTKVAFESSADLTGNNADRNSEIFLFDAATSGLTQVTDTRSQYLNRTAAISGDAAKIVFARYNFGFENPAQIHLASQLYLFDVATSSFTELSLGQDPSINSDGTRITFVRRNPLIDGEPSGSEVFYYHTITSGVTQVTNGTDPYSYSVSLEPTISSDGTKIAYQSGANLTGSNADGNWEVFLFDATANSLIQITDTRGGENNYPSSGLPAISGDGARVVFQSTANLTGNNPNGNLQIFLSTAGDLFAAAPDVEANAPAPAAAAVDEAVADDDSSGGESRETAFAPTGDGLGGLNGPIDERVGGEEATDRDLAFATFAGTEVHSPVLHGLVAALVTGRLTL